MEVDFFIYLFSVVVDRELRLRRPGQKALSFWVWLVVRSRDRSTPAISEGRLNSESRLRGGNPGRDLHKADSAELSTQAQ